jgi:probable HAF family extracellular repeat protein
MTTGLVYVMVREGRRERIRAQFPQAYRASLPNHRLLTVEFGKGKKMGARASVVVAVAALTLAGSQALGATPSFRGLGDLPGGWFLSSAEGVSADGSVVVGSSGSSNASTYEAFRWSNGLMSGLGVGAGGYQPSSMGLAVSADGSVVVGRVRALPYLEEAFRWCDGVMSTLGNLPGPGSSFGEGVSADGSVVVGVANAGAAGFTSPQAFRWADGVMSGLGYLAGGEYLMSWAHGVSADGSVVVGWGRSANGGEAFRWSNGVMSGLGDLPGDPFFSEASALSADGSVVVGAGDIHTDANGLVVGEAFRWANGIMSGLGDLPGGAFASWASAVSRDGSIVVGGANAHVELDPSGFPLGRGDAFIWDAAHGMRNLRDLLVNDFGLNLDGWALNGATGVSEDGRTIVGTGFNPEGNQEAWIATIPEPAGLPLLVVGAGALVRRRRKR